MADLTFPLNAERAQTWKPGALCMSFTMMTTEFLYAEFLSK